MSLASIPLVLHHVSNLWQQSPDDESPDDPDDEREQSPDDEREMKEEA
jgi:hypothetical protein